MKNASDEITAKALKGQVLSHGISYVSPSADLTRLYYLEVSGTKTVNTKLERPEKEYEEST